jgi:hypothetical protein
MCFVLTSSRFLENKTTFCLEKLMKVCQFSRQTTPSLCLRWMRPKQFKSRISIEKVRNVIRKSGTLFSRRLERTVRLMATLRMASREFKIIIDQKFRPREGPKEPRPAPIEFDRRHRYGECMAISNHGSDRY